MVKRKIIWSPRAKIDQFKILDYYFKRNGNKTYSRKLFKRFKNATNLIVKHPEIGIRTDIKNIRNLIEGDYAIFYRINPNTVEIITIWDCRQDTEKLEYR
ncbi:MAG: type II toxin-antitoxin system RelE/ParE family toxin [Bacteroidales bacterium]|nr:type II toxin-antitoxin system RelE/ParE family toxin [Bacteroidales bacterium]